MTEPSMRDRLARALLKAHYERGRGIAPRWDFIDKFEREMWLYSADAALAELKTPTEAMLTAAGPSMERVNDLLSLAAVHGATLTWEDDKPPLWHAWQAMIDAASTKKG